MKKSLLATAAAVALIAGAGFASAAEGPKQQPAAGHAEMNKGPAPKAETTGAGPEEKAEPKGEMKAEPKGDMKAAPKADMKSGTRTETKSDSKTEMKSENKADPRNKAETKSDSKDMKSENKADSKDMKSEKADSKTGADTKAKSATDEKGSPNAKSAADAKGNANGGKTASLTTEQKTKIRTTVIEKGNAPKVSRSSINFNISIGTHVPRSVHFVTVPPTIVEYYPAYRGFDYFVVDEQIIILDPNTLEIVAVIDV